MSENEKAPETVPTDLTLEQEKELIEQTVFPKDEYELPDQTPEDIFKDKEPGA